MPTFAARDRRVITIEAPAEAVATALSSPERIRQFLADDLDRGEVVDPRTLHIVRKPVEEKGVKFRGDYQVQYTRADLVVTWKTITTGNMRSTGEARITALGDRRSRLEYDEALECDMEVNRILGAVLRPIVERKIKNGITTYLDKVKAALEKPA
jgi:carbon monoxide dehydrogenase subunit G